MVAFFHSKMMVFSDFTLIKKQGFDNENIGFNHEKIIWWYVVFPPAVEKRSLTMNSCKGWFCPLATCLSMMETETWLQRETCRKPLLLVVKTMLSHSISLKSIQWNLGYLFLQVLAVSSSFWCGFWCINHQFRKKNAKMIGHQCSQLRPVSRF